MDIEKLLHPIKVRVEEAVTDVKLLADKDKAVIAADVRAKIAEAEATIAQVTPELEVAAKAAFAVAKAAVEAALASHGL